MFPKQTVSVHYLLMHTVLNEVGVAGRGKWGNFQMACHKKPFSGTAIICNQKNMLQKVFFIKSLIKSYAMNASMIIIIGDLTDGGIRQLNSGKR